MATAKCALCGESRECSSKEIEGKEYDLCVECWDELSLKLSGKGREVKHRTSVIIPPLETPQEKPDQPAPGEPPKIWFRSGRPH